MTGTTVRRAYAAQVETLSGYGLEPEAIATVLDIELAELERDYKLELKSGAYKANVKIAESLFRKATGDGPQAVSAAIFWMKTRAGWKERNVTELAAPVRVNLTWEDAEL